MRICDPVGTYRAAAPARLATGNPSGAQGALMPARNGSAQSASVSVTTSSEKAGRCCGCNTCSNCTRAGHRRASSSEGNTWIPRSWTAFSSKAPEALRVSVSDIPDPREQPGSCIVVRAAWTVEKGIVTPTLKTRRMEPEKHYAARSVTWQKCKGVHRKGRGRDLSMLPSRTRRIRGIHRLAPQPVKQLTNPAVTLTVTPSALPPPPAECHSPNPYQRKSPRAG